VIYQHALRNALIPLVRSSRSAARLLGGTVIVEAIFAWPAWDAGITAVCGGGGALGIELRGI